MSELDTRRRLVAEVSRGEAELARALDDLKRATAQRLALGDRLRDHVVAHPLPWLAAALVVGLWLGRRRH